jgi:type IV secretory pathway component VirB8
MINNDGVQQSIYNLRRDLARANEISENQAAKILRMRTTLFVVAIIAAALLTVIVVLVL